MVFFEIDQQPIAKGRTDEIATLGGNKMVQIANVGRSRPFIDPISITGRYEL